MRRGTILWVTGLLAIGLLVWGAVSILHNGLSARATPTEMEAMIARNVRRIAIPKDAGKLPNPTDDSAATLREGRLHFADHCAVCHANDGSGDTMIGKGLYPKPPDLRLHGTQQLSDGEIFWIIENGVRFTGMPAFGGTHGSKEDSWKLVRFIRHLPQLTAEEHMEMERYNPKGPDEREEEQEEQDFLKGPPEQQKQQPKHHQ